MSATKNGFKKFFTARKIFTTLLIVVGIVFTYLIYVTSGSGDESKDALCIERLYYSVQIVIGIYVVIGAVVGIWQYCISTRSEVIKNESDKVSKAVDLAGYYKDNIIVPFSFIRCVYTESGAMDIIGKIGREEMDNFDHTELTDVLSEEDISILKGMEHKPEFVEAVHRANCIYNLSANECFNAIKMQNNVCQTSQTKQENEDNLDSRISREYVSNQMRALLNNLEYFAMYFTHNIADDSVVFQSLHQSYFDIVEMMYYNISDKNIEPHHKYYVNVIKLYKKWKEKDKKNQHEIESAKQVYNKRLHNRDLGTVPANFTIK